MSDWRDYAQTAPHAPAMRSRDSTPGSALDLSDEPCRAFQVIGAGDLTVELPGDAAAIEFSGVEASLLPIPISLETVDAASTAAVRCLW